MPFEQLVRRGAHAFAASVNSHRILVYSLISTLAVCAAIANALKNYSNFYSVAIYLSKSSRSVLILANFAFLQALLCGHVIQRLFFGSLRPNEIERLYDRLWFFITESLLAFTIFRDEFDIPFALMFGFLLFVKSFHWLAGDRIEWMDQRPYPGPPLLFHVRMTILFAVLWFTDILMFLVAIESTLNYGVGGMVLFASEYGILMASITNTILKYSLTSYELRRASRRGGENAPPWENKSMWVFYIELATDFMKLTTYLAFFVIIITFYGLPLNIVRDVYITARSFISRLRALHRYQSATRNMDQRYPNATEEEMNAMNDRTCIICREEMVLNRPAGAHVTPGEGPNTTPKKLPCGHIFHFYCLRSWLERQQSCPTCRRTVFENTTLPQQAPVGRPAAGGPAPARGADLPQQGMDVFQEANGRANARGFNNLGNPRGFIGRMFGPPAPPAGQAENGDATPAPANRNPGGTNIRNDAGQAPGLVVQYNIQYHIPRPGQQDQPQVQPPSSQTHQPPPRFPGFFGPGGVWQPWPQEENAVGQAGQTPTGDHRSDAAQGASSNQSPSPMDSMDPRRSAAAAALRRFDMERGRSAQGLSTDQAAHPPTPSSSSDPSAGSATAQTRSESATTESTVESYRNSDGPLHIPSLIPLYDHVTPERPQFSTAAFHPQLQHLSGTSQTSPSRPSSALADSSSQVHASQLPPNLTDEQLSVLDSVTREAIDERLRVLEGVSAAVNQSIENLLRMRSVLPASDAPQNLQVASESAAPAPSADDDSGLGMSGRRSSLTETDEVQREQVDSAGSQSA